LNSSAIRSCRKNTSEVRKAVMSASGDGAARWPRRSDEKHTADALNAATSGAWPASGNRSRWYVTQRFIS